jgi:hypothetical protein
MDALPVFFIAIASGVVLGVATLMIIYKMVDGDLPVGPGLGAMIMIVVVMALAIRPPHPAVPGAVLVVAVTLMAFFPYAEKVLEAFELRAIDANRMAKSYAAVEARADNFAAKFELAKLLFEHGFHAQAINLARTTLDSLKDDRDEVRNQSLRDMFHREELLMKRWISTTTESVTTNSVCPSCGARNGPADIFCIKCRRPYLLDIVRSQEVKPRVWAKLVLAWATLALFIPGFVAIGMNLEGALRVIAFCVAFAGIGALLAWLFRPPRHATATYAMD